MTDNERPFLRRLVQSLHTRCNCELVLTVLVNDDSLDGMEGLILAE